jgi:LysM repeat protein
MAAVITIPTRSPHHDPRPRREPVRPPLTVIPGGRRAAREYAARQRPAHRLHPAVYRRRRLGLVVGLVTAVVVGYLALTGLRVLTADAAPSAPATTAVAGAPAAGSVYVVHPGDTLWSIARSLQPSGDVRSLVDRLADRAGPGPLQAGQSLRIDGLVP